MNQGDRTVTVSAVILAAGSGTRMKSAVPKQRMEVCGKPLFLYSVEAFAEIADEVILVTGAGDIPLMQDLLRQFEPALPVPVNVTEGGSERSDSSYRGICAARGDYVMIHDAARCCVSGEVIRDSLESALQFGSGVAAVPCKDTVKIVRPASPDQPEVRAVESTPLRQNVVVVQTPQTFRREELLAAYDRFRNAPERRTVTDDAGVMEDFGSREVVISAGSYENIKVTTPEDLYTVETILKNRKNAKNG